ncbi:HAMP domain-containing histidine kinase [Mucilaginibacter sp. Bleaf8]|uniref:sensor histidine kinase n=1 Tax=Mucilaginibacter sp. Bleaf8 TaxID=2834430 RepID=UPI001BCE509D|nr:HAMP domain-containing sensor histidine kinase [Mucilaginibacter sp. Bleaf8]MBS7564432.1 HAMP domain-containing histidine kinase [Mucilaginibacter sp. Bleaf8]
MLEISSITLDNEMDLPLTHKRAAIIGQQLGLSLSTQTTFATAVSEVCRVVLERTLENLLSFYLEDNSDRWFLIATIRTAKTALNKHAEEFKYAHRLVPILEVRHQDGHTFIDLKLGLPRTVQLTKLKVNKLIQYMQNSITITPYEEIKQKNQELINLAGEREEQLRLSNILNAKKSEFLSIASHELRTPLTVIKAYAQVAKTLKDPNRLVEYLDKIDQQASKVNVLIQQLMDLSKIENDKVDYRMERVDFNKFLSDVVTSAELSNPNHHISLELAHPVHPSMDRLRIEQVLVNLIGNAAKYSASGKNITVKVDVSIPHLLTVSVADQGVGISKKDLSKVFEKFFRADGVTKNVAGLGMGLYITTRIIKEHNGKIWAESTEGQGSTFYFSLPTN